jgi:hypothetical protein
MTKHLSLAATALILSSDVTSAQDQPSQDTTDVPAALQRTTPDKPPVAKVPEAATDVVVYRGGRRRDKHPTYRRRWVLRWAAPATSENRPTKSKMRTPPPGFVAPQMQTKWL